MKGHGKSLKNKYFIENERSMSMAQDPFDAEGFGGICCYVNIEMLVIDMARKQ